MKFVSALALVLLWASPIAAEVPGEPQPEPKEAYVPARLNSDGDAIVSGLNRFTLDLYAQARSEGGDLAISPASVSTAFGLAYAGARGKTAEEIASVLRYPSLADFHPSFGALLRTMDLHQNGRTLAVNNAIWLQEGLKVRPEYAELVHDNYGAGLQRVDYRHHSEAARAKINAWVERQTNNRIRNLLSKENVTRGTRSVLVNTIYFKADWADPFYKEATKDKPFTLASGRRIARPLMHRRLDVGYAQQSGIKAVAIPYRGDETEMVFFLPDKADGLQSLERSLTPEVLGRWMKKLERRAVPVDVLIPRFRIESRLELKDTLQHMGMHTVFSNNSDFSGLKAVNAASPDQEDWNLKIDNVVHQVFVEVEEKGTEAAAATAGVAILITGARVTEPLVFRADHPFLFLIRDRRTNAILFIGRYTGER
jgi:serine protease inhibitor